MSFTSRIVIRLLARIISVRGVFYTGLALGSSCRLALAQQLLHMHLYAFRFLVYQ